MVDGESEAGVPLGPPPRAVTLVIRCHLLAGIWTFMGSFFLGVGSVFALSLGLECDPFGSLRLALGAKEAPGLLKDVQETHYQENDERVYRFAYKFRLPDGTLERGVSYWPGKSFDEATRRAPAAAGMAVTVEYEPTDSRLSRIKGTRSGMCANWVLFVFLFPALGLLMLLAGLNGGRRQLRLMKWGEAVEAELTVCHSSGGDSPVDVPVVKFKEDWHAQMRGVRQVLRRFTPLPLALRGFVGLWTCGIIAFVVFDVLFCLAGIASLLVNFPIRLNAPPEMQLLGCGVILAFLIISLTMVSFMMHGMSPVKFRRRGRPATDPDQPPGWLAWRQDIPNIDCAFECRLPNGDVAQGRDTITLTGAPEEDVRQPALFDPQHSSRIMLVSSLLPFVWVGPGGDWETNAGRTALLRAAAVIILCVAGPAIGLIIHIVGM
jgi:hypothetical protein